MTPIEQPKEGRETNREKAEGILLAVNLADVTTHNETLLNEVEAALGVKDAACRSELERVVGELRKEVKKTGLCEAICRWVDDDTEIKHDDDCPLAAFERRCGELGVNVKV